MKERVLSALLCLAVVSSAAACAAARPNLLTIYGAASLANALDELVDVYTSSGTPPSFAVSTGSSAALRTQIEQGASADLFLSADTANPQALVDAGRTDGPVETFATNRLTIAVPKGNPAAITSPLDLARPDVRVIAAGDDVPITKYAVQVVDKLAALPDYSADFAATYQSNIVSREDSVGAVTAKIALGEGDAAIVYVTDALAANVDTVEFPADANIIATYGAAVLKTPASSLAHEFLAWLKSADGQDILTTHGFSAAQ